MEPNLPPSLLDYYDAKYLNCSETELSVMAIDICDKLNKKRQTSWRPPQESSQLQQCGMIIVKGA